MAENVQETKPPEPPPKPPEVPKPTERSSRSEASSEGAGGPDESQRSAREDARSAAQAEHAKAMNGAEPEGLRATPEVQERLDARRGLEPAAEVRERLDAHRGPQPTPEVPDAPGRDTTASQEASSGAGNSERDAASQADEQAANRDAAAERAVGNEGTTTPPPTEPAHAPDTEAQETPQRQAIDEQVAAPHEATVVPQAAAGEQDQPRPPALTVEEPAPSGETPGGDGPDDNPPRPPDNGHSGPERRQHEAQHLDPAGDLRDQSETDTPATTESDESAERNARVGELRNEGHGPQRHLDPTDDQLKARKGDPVLNPQSGEPVLKDNGHVRSQNQIDPMTGTTVDGVHGGVHRCGDYATRFDSAEDYVAADRFLRARAAESGDPIVDAPISDVLGPDGHDRLSGYYLDPAARGELKPVDFAGGAIRAVYQRDVSGDLTLITMYPNPASLHQNQQGGTTQ